MARYVMLTVDLNADISEEQRDLFNERLKKLSWIKLSLTTTWFAEFNAGVENEAAIDASISDVSDAAVIAKISNYEAAFHVGAEPPTITTVKPGLRRRPG